MSANEDKYPVESDRRRFVKGIVGAAALGGIGSTGAAAVNTSTPPEGTGGGVVDFMGIEVIGGPADHPMPIIPVEIEDDGTISGRWPEPQEIEIEGETEFIAEEELGGITYSSQWYQYCGKQTSPGLLPQAQQDNTFVSSPQAQYEWQTEELDEDDPLNLDHFEDYEEWGNDIGDDGIGKPAAVTWRSDGLDGGDVLDAVVIRSSQIEEDAEDDEFLAEATEEGVFAYLNVCSHFCCIPGYKVSEAAESAGTGNEVFCQCHQSLYDPFDIVEDSLVSFPQPDDVEEEAEADDDDDDDDEDDDADDNGEEDEENGDAEGDDDEENGAEEGEEGEDEDGEDEGEDEETGGDV